MANTKTYTIVKDGETLKELKTLATAKKLADAEGAEVFCEGECVYQGAVADTVAPSVEEETAEPVKAPERMSTEETPGKNEFMWHPDEQDMSWIHARLKKHPLEFCLFRKMNVRKEPSLSAEVLTVLKRGTDVSVKAIQDDWLCLTNGGFILFENGKNAIPTRYA